VTFDRQGPHFCNSVDCFIKPPTSAKSSEFAFNKNFILFNGISSIKSGLFNIILLNKLFLRVCKGYRRVLKSPYLQIGT
jgi:hypothetical protein